MLHTCTAHNVTHKHITYSHTQSQTQILYKHQSINALTNIHTYIHTQAHNEMDDNKNSETSKMLTLNSRAVTLFVKCQVNLEPITHCDRQVFLPTELPRQLSWLSTHHHTNQDTYKYTPWYYTCACSTSLHVPCATSSIHTSDKTRPPSPYPPTTISCGGWPVIPEAV